MGKQCYVTGRKASTGNNRSHSFKCEQTQMER